MGKSTPESLVYYVQGKKELEAKARRAQSEHEVALTPNHRGIEESAFRKVLDPLSLEIHQVRNGHPGLYSMRET